MYDHIGLRVRNLELSVRFYSAALVPLGHALCTRDDAYAGFGPKRAPALWLHATTGTTGSGVHVALRAADHAAVERFYQEGLKAGGAGNGKPGPRTDYGPKYYAAFLIDPDGNNIEAVCLK